MSSAAAWMSGSCALLLLLEQRIEQALAHAEHGDHHLLRLDHAHQIFHHQRGVSQQRPAGGVDDFDLGQRLGVDAVHQAREFERLARGDAVIVHDMERIAGLPHVEAGERAPGAADRVEGAALARAEHVEILKGILDDSFGLLDRLAGDVLQRQAAERQRELGAHARAVHVDQFERAAAQVADDAVRLVHAGDHTERGQIGLALARQNLDRRAADALGLANEGVPVARVAAGGGGDRPDLAHMQNVAERAEAAQRIERGIDGVLRQQAGGLHLAAEAGEHFFVEDRGRRPRQPLIDDEAHRVRADIDDGDGRPMLEPALGIMHDCRRAFTCLRRGGV